MEQLLKYENEFMSLIQLLHEKTYSKRGYSWAGKFLSGLLLTLTHTYPLENKFVNPDVWDSPGQARALNYLDVLIKVFRIPQQSPLLLGQIIQTRGSQSISFLIFVI